MNLLRGLLESMSMLFEEGLDNDFARHARFVTVTRKAVEAWGLITIAKEGWQSDTPCCSKSTRG